MSYIVLPWSFPIIYSINCAQTGVHVVHDPYNQMEARLKIQKWSRTDINGEWDDISKIALGVSTSHAELLYTRGYFVFGPAALQTLATAPEGPPTKRALKERVLVRGPSETRQFSCSGWVGADETQSWSTLI